MKSFISKLFSITAVVLCYTIFCTQTSWAVAEPQPTQDAPVQRPVVAASYASPEAEAQVRLANAHTLFIENDGADDAFPARAGDGYTRFVTDVESWGRYRIVSNIAEADLVLQFRAATTTTVVDGTTDSPGATVYHNPYFKLTVADPATLRPIWPITIPVETGKARKTKADLFALSVENAESQLKLLVGEPLTSQETAAMAATAESRHIGKAGVWVTVGVVGLIAATAIVTPILMKNAYNDAVAKQKQAQLDFCKTYHISPCPV